MLRRTVGEGVGRSVGEPVEGAERSVCGLGIGSGVRLLGKRLETRLGEGVLERGWVGV